ncbi:MAG: AAA family ATPase [Desulfovibrio sp.]|nr:AAA family ATPase [Desulfovibrio sp.]
MAFFSTGLKYFKGLDIEKVWDDKTYKVVHLDFSTIVQETSSKFKQALGYKIIEEFDAKEIVAQYDELGVRDPDIILSKILKNIDNNSVVLLIDEYDTPLTYHLDNSDELKDILSLLNCFYATVKRYTGNFRLIFITGITRSIRTSIFSTFNNFLDISFDSDFNQLLGFTQDDLHRYFDKYVENAAQVLSLKKEDVYQRLNQYYGGFQFSLDANETVYNPLSLLSFFKQTDKGFQDCYFNSDSTNSLIMKYLKVNNSDLMNYNDREIYINKEELAIHYQITDTPLDILLYQAGFLTIKKMTGNAAKLEFPNTEVKNSLLYLYPYKNTVNSSSRSDLSLHRKPASLFSKIIRKK